MDNNRRGFLISSGLLAVGSLLPSSVGERIGVGSFLSPFIVVFHTKLKRSYSEKDFEFFKNKYLDKKKYASLFESFTQREKIISSHSFFDGTNHKFVVVFNNKASYYSWCYSAVNRKCINEYRMLKYGLTNVNYGQHISLKDAESEIPELLERLDDSKFTVLHKTKSLRDLSEFQLGLS